MSITAFHQVYVIKGTDLMTSLSAAVLRVTLDLREPPDLRVRRAKEDLLVRLVPLDPLACVEHV